MDEELTSSHASEPGRPPLDIDPAKVEAMASIGCSIEDIAFVMGCSRDTIERRFREQIDKGKATGRCKLRRLQWNSADKGDVRMQIWLGKQMLNQSEKQTIENITPGTTPHGELAKHATPEELEKLYAIHNAIEERTKSADAAEQSTDDRGGAGRTAP